MLDFGRSPEAALTDEIHHAAWFALEMGLVDPYYSASARALARLARDVHAGLYDVSKVPRLARKQAAWSGPLHNLDLGGFGPLIQRMTDEEDAKPRSRSGGGAARPGVDATGRGSGRRDRPRSSR